MKAVTALLVAALAVATVAPLVVAMPLLSQTPELLAFAHAAEKLAPALSIAAAAALALRLWRGGSRGAWALLAVTALCAVLSRMNLLERMFAPARDAIVMAAGSYRDIRDTDMVIGVTLGGSSRAYPVRYLAYHHMLNDRLGPTALLPTY